VLPTFVIGLREGLEAALIVGIVAAFLKQEQRKDALRWMWLGVLLAVSLCVAAGVALRVASEQLPQREQEQLETVIGLIAVGMITWMIVWMRNHAKNLRGDLEGKASAALLEGGTLALVGMAFLAVLREGLETAVFLLAVFQDSDDPGLTGTGAALGVLLAIVLGYLIYRGGVKINLARFFKLTGVVLVLVAAGLLAMAVHTAHESGWWNLLLDEFVDLSAVIKPGTVASALITGMFGIQPKPTVGEALAWVVYAVPMTIFVLSAPSVPRKQAAPTRAPTPPVPSAV
jgi:high-affinity iron transporter